MDKKIIYINSIAIALLALVATLSGLFWKGLYKHDTISGVAQMMGQDLVTLVICIPILIGTLYLISKDSFRGKESREETAHKAAWAAVKQNPKT